MAFESQLDTEPSWIEQLRRRFSFEYFVDAFGKHHGGIERPSGNKGVHEWFCAEAFAFWLRMRDSLDSSIELLDLDGRGEPDCRFDHKAGSFWVEQFGLYFPPDKLAAEAAVHRLDRRIREELHAPFPVTTSYESYRDLPTDGTLRLLGRALGQDLGRQLLTSEEASVSRPVRIKVKRHHMDIVTIGTSDIATPVKARESFANQLAIQLPEARAKLAAYDLDRSCILITTYHTNGAQEVPAAFRALDPYHYSDLGGVFWFNSQRPFTVRSLFERETLFAREP